MPSDRGYDVPDDVIVLTKAGYTYDDYVGALRAFVNSGPGHEDRPGFELVYDDLLGAFLYERNSRDLDNLIMGIHAVLDETEEGSAWTGAAGELVAKIRKIIEDEDVRE